MAYIFIIISSFILTFMNISLACDHCNDDNSHRSYQEIENKFNNHMREDAKPYNDDAKKRHGNFYLNKSLEKEDNNKTDKTVINYPIEDTHKILETNEHIEIDKNLDINKKILSKKIK